MELSAVKAIYVHIDNISDHNKTTLSIERPQEMFLHTKMTEAMSNLLESTFRAT